MLAAGGTFLSNGYSGTLGGPRNPLSGRSGWTGNSGGFVWTQVQLAPGLLNEPIRFRWIMAQDRNGSGEGWYVDDVATTTAGYEEPGVPELDLAAVDGTAAELGGTDPSEVRVVTPLPLLTPRPFSLTSGGTAAAADVTGLDLASMPAGRTAEPIILTAVNDGLVEGPETLKLTLDPDSSYLVGATGMISAPLSFLPDDVVMFAEQSTDLANWDSVGMQTLADAFAFPLAGPEQFLRIGVELAP